MLGPILIANGRALMELNVALRSVGQTAKGLIPEDPDQVVEMESWLEHQASWLRPAGVRLYQAKVAGRSDPDAEQLFARSLGRMNRALQTREYLAGPFSLADCTAPFLFGMTAAGIELPEAPALTAYLERVRMRPGLEHANLRWSALGSATLGAEDATSAPSAHSADSTPPKAITPRAPTRLPVATAPLETHPCKARAHFQRRLR